MKVKIIKDHHVYKGTVEVEDARGKYLVAMGIAEEVVDTKEVKKTKS